MSRTFRRKNRKPSWFVTHDYKLVGDYKKWDWQWVPYEGEELKEQIAKHHTSDNHSGIHSAPSWYVREYFTKKQRRKQRDMLRKIIITGDYENYLFDPHKKDAGYDWW